MKKTIYIISLFALSLLAAGCYPDYVEDFDHTAVYMAYQYDLRTFVLGEDESFKVGVTLGGTISNGMDRKVCVELDDALVDGDLSQFETYDAQSEDGNGGIVPFTAFDGMMGKAPVGTLINSYVTNEMNAMPVGFSALKPLPSTYYTVVGDPSGLVIGKGAHTATLTIKANTEALTADARTVQPYFALGFKITKADADTVLRDKSFEIIAVKYENRFFGNWYHSGKAVTVDNASGSKLDELVYTGTVPQAESDLYVLSTVAASTVRTNRISYGQVEGQLDLTFDGDEITVTDPFGVLAIKSNGDGSYFNRAKLLQDRKLFLNYKFDNGNGSTTIVTDTLTFRNRVRDGINEWQDENPEHYE